MTRTVISCSSAPSFVLNEELVKLAQQEDYAVYCDDENFKKQAGKRPSPLQYFIASIGFCMFSQLKRFARESRGV